MTMILCPSSLYVYTFEVVLSQLTNLDQIFYIKHHQAGGKAALGFWADWMGLLVATASIFGM